MTRIVVSIILAVIVALGGVSVGAQQGRAESALRAAIETETVKGDVNGAITQYKRIIDQHKDNRPIAAQALLRVADAYRRLGDAQARAAYERLVREYSDQPEPVAAAQRFLNQAASAGAVRGDRVVRSGESVTSGDGRVSPDGRFICYTDWDHTGNLMVHDLAAGTDRAITGNKDWSTGNAYSSTFSPDGKQIAYGWRTYGQPAHTNELRVVSAAGSATPQPRRIHSNQDIDFYNPVDWSPDGQWLATLVVRKDRTGQIAMVGVQDGSFRVLKSFGWRGPNKIFFSPDGKYLAYDMPATATDSQRDVFIIAVDGSREVKAVEHAAQDMVMAWTPDGRLLFASDRAGTLGLWALPVSDGKPQRAANLVKPDIGTGLSQGLTASGSLYTVKDASTISLQLAPIDLAAGRLTGPAVLENFRAGRPDWTTDGRQLAYRRSSSSGVPAIMVRTTDSGRTRELRPALLYINEPRWLADGRSLVTAGRDFNGRGVVVRVDADTGRETFLDEASAVGRVQVSADGKHIYYGTGDGGVVRNVETGEVKKMAELQRAAGVLFGNREHSPDGKLAAVVRTEAGGKRTTLLVYPVEGGEPRPLLTVSHPDALQRFGGLTWTPDSKGVVLVKLTGEPGVPKDLWLVPTDGGAARKLEVDITAWKTVDGIRLHPNGRQIGFFSGDDAREVWAFESVAPKSSRR